MGFKNKQGKYIPTTRLQKGCNECQGTGMVKVASPSGGTEKLKCLGCRPIRGNEKYLKIDQSLLRSRPIRGNEKYLERRR